MPYSDPDTQRKAKAESARRRRAQRRLANVEPGDCGTVDVDESVEPMSARIASLRLRVPADAIRLLERAVATIEADTTAREIEKGRALAYVASVALRAIESSDITKRLSALESGRALRAVS